MLVNCLSL